MNTQNDVLNWLAPSAPFSLEWHLHDPLTNDSYGVLLPGQLWLPKAAASAKFTGFDMNTFDENLVYQKLTELDWVSGDFKSFVGPGIPWCPRYWTPGASNLPIVTQNSNYVTVKGGTPTPGTANVGTVITQLSGPYPITDPLAAFGGDIGTLPYVKITYQWGFGATLETFYYAKPYGWVKWTTSNLVAGAYVIQKTSLFNQIVAGGYGPVNFPWPIPA
jgi:hypothetical protein